MHTEQQDISIVEVNPVDLIASTREIAAEHWHEVPFGDFDIELSMAEESYATMYESGHCKAVAAIESGGTVVGYVLVLASEMLHHKGTYQMTTDSFYVDPAYRHCGLFSKMMDMTETLCRSNGIRFMSYVINPTFSACYEMESWLIERGFQCTEKTYTIEVESWL